MENICTVLITLFGEYIEREKKGPMLLHIQGTKTSLTKNNNNKKKEEQHKDFVGKSKKVCTSYKD